MLSYKKHISIFMIAMAQLLMIAHAVIPHHHHNEGLLVNVCCEHSHDSNADLQAEDDHDCCSGCHFLNTLFSQVQIDYQFVENKNLFFCCSGEAKITFKVFNEIPIQSLHPADRALRAPPLA